MSEIDKTIPNKVIIDPQPTDYVHGDGNIDPEISLRALTSDWTPYVPNPENQSGNGFETDDCTAFSYTNVVETQYNYFLKAGKLPAATIQFLSQNGYLDGNGMLNCSDRALGSMAGTTSQGNSLNKVAET